MTYHRTGGKGGSRNTAQGPLPNFNKEQGSGARRRGKMMPNAAPSKGNYPPPKTQDTNA